MEIKKLIRLISFLIFNIANMYADDSEEITEADVDLFIETIDILTRALIEKHNKNKD